MLYKAFVNLGYPVLQLVAELVSPRALLWQQQVRGSRKAPCFATYWSSLSQRQCNTPRQSVASPYLILQI